MTQTATFGEVLDAADQLSLDERAALIDILRRRIADERRQQLLADVQEARAELAAGGGRAVTTDELIGEILT